MQTQQDQQKEYCAERSYIVLEEHVFIEIETGDDSWRERKVLQKLLIAARNHEFTVLVLYHTDRLARGDDLIILWHELLYNGVRIESVSQNLEDTMEGRIMLHILAITSKMEHDRILRRTQDNKRTNVQNGNLFGGIPLYGYQYKDPTRRTKDARDSRNCYILHPEHSRVVLQIFVWCDEGKSIWKICALLMEQGIPSPNGKEVWQTSTVGRMLRNPFYTGKATMYKQKIDKSNGKKRFIDRAEEEQILLPDGVVPRIVDDDLFERVQERLVHNKQYAVRHNQHVEDSLLRCGYAICAYCKKPMTAYWNDGQQRSLYKCNADANHRKCKSNCITSYLIDGPAWKKAQEVILNPTKLQEFIAEMQDDEDQPEEYQPISIDGRLAAIEQEIFSLVDLKKVATSETAHARIRHDLEQLEAEQKKLLGEKKKNAAIAGKWELAQAEIKKFEAWCEDFRKRLDTATYADKRYAIERLGIKVVVYKYGTRPRYKIYTKPPKLVDIVLRISGDRLL